MCGCNCGCGGGGRGPWRGRGSIGEDRIALLKEHQRDLEEQAADVAAEIARLKQAPTTAS